MTLFNILSIYLPSCLERHPCGKYCFLNRHLLPVGFNSIDWKETDRFPLIQLSMITKELAIELSINNSEEKNINKIKLEVINR